MGAETRENGAIVVTVSDTNESIKFDDDDAAAGEYGPKDYNESIKEDASEAERKLRCGEIFSGRKLVLAWFVTLIFLSIYFPGSVIILHGQREVLMLICLPIVVVLSGFMLFITLVKSTLSQTRAYIQAKLLIRKAKRLNMLVTEAIQIGEGLYRF